jgi:predicted DNA-binding antitoxin AbrB/MazE fold protein
MMTQIEAMYRNGVFKPLEEVSLSENQRGWLSVQPIEAGDARDWLTRVQQRQQRIVAERGYFPDSTFWTSPRIARDERHCRG